MKKLLKNTKGTAEVIGTVLFIVILLFFFTNVYLWHDAATKEMNELYVQKINSQISASYDPITKIISVTNNGGLDAVISGLWLNVQSASSVPDSNHQFFNLIDRNYIVSAGDSPILIRLADTPINYDPAGKTGIFKVITTTGNVASCHF
jgi:hypothetical protein